MTAKAKPERLGPIHVALPRLFALHGEAYIVSEEKQRFDRYVASLLLGPAAVGTTVAEILIYGWREGLTGRHPFVQQRVGPHGTVTETIKVKTMRDPEPGETLDITRFSPRILSRRARFVRIMGLDELPQMQKVASGEWSLVGPRPLVQASIDQYISEAREDGAGEGEIEDWLRFQDIARRGIFGVAQASLRMSSGRDGLRVVRSDVDYYHNASFVVDLQAIASSIGTLMVAGLHAAVRRPEELGAQTLPTPT